MPKARRSTSSPRGDTVQRPADLLGIHQRPVRKRSDRCGGALMPPRRPFFMAVKRSRGERCRYRFAPVPMRQVASWLGHEGRPLTVCAHANRRPEKRGNPDPRVGVAVVRMWVDGGRPTAWRSPVVRRVTAASPRRWDARRSAPRAAGPAGRIRREPKRRAARSRSIGR